MPYLRKQKDRYYATWDIPEKLRPKFGGKRRLTKSTGTGDKLLAQRRAYQIVEKWKQVAEGTYWDWVVDQLPDDGQIVAVGEEQGQTIYEPFDLEFTLEDIAYTHELERDDDFKVAIGEYIRLADYLDPWITQLTTATKSNDQKRLEVSRFLEEFPYPHLVTRRKLKDFLEGQGLASTSLKRALGNIRSFWFFVEMETDKNLGDPFKNLSVVGKPRTEKKPFTFSEICKIHAELKTEDQKLIVQIAALSGMRIEEICSSQYGDHLVQISESKTKAGIRVIPLHSQLDANVISKMQSRLKPGKYERLSHTIGKDINRQIRGLGFGHDKTFHSIRKYVATCFENNGVDELIASRILGHNLKTMSYGLYSGGQDPENLRPAVEELNWIQD